MSRRVVSFDLDDTLAPSKSAIADSMAELLGELLGTVSVCIISGGRFEQFKNQVLAHLNFSPDLLSDLHLMPTCGTQYYRWRDDDWLKIYSDDLGDDEIADITRNLLDSATALDLWPERSWGEKIENRGSQVTFSALGQSAPVAAKASWDPDGARRQLLRSHLAEKLEHFEVSVGGSTSIDVTRKGVDKAYGINRLMNEIDVSVEELLFFGDKLQEGGNDYPVKRLGVRCVPVSDWKQTERYVGNLLSWLGENPNGSFSAFEPDSSRLPE